MSDPSILGSTASSIGGEDSGAPSGNDTLARLADVIESRRKGDPDKSYVARLFSKGPDAILKKVGEEATEAVMAGKDADPKKIVYEVADLWFHSMLMLSMFNLRPSDVLAELERREGLSGLEEFAARKAVRRESDEANRPADGPGLHADLKTHDPVNDDKEFGGSRG